MKSGHLECVYRSGALIDRSRRDLFDEGFLCRSETHFSRQIHDCISATSVMLGQLSASLGLALI
jgi:hypothetical protein